MPDAVALGVGGLAWTSEGLAVEAALALGRGHHLVHPVQRTGGLRPDNLDRRQRSQRRTAYSGLWGRVEDGERVLLHRLREPVHGPNEAVGVRDDGGLRGKVVEGGEILRVRVGDHAIASFIGTGLGKCRSAGPIGWPMTVLAR